MMSKKEKQKTKEDIWERIPESEESSIEKWEDFEKELEKCNSPDWIFRGQAKAEWDLESSLYRVFQREGFFKEDYKYKKLRDMENDLYGWFKDGSILYINATPEKFGKDHEWASLMQHYHVPTRALDMTSSPYVATFFALTGDGCESAVLAVNQKEICNKFEQYIKRNQNNEYYFKEIILKLEKYIIENPVTKGFFMEIIEELLKHSVPAINYFADTDYNSENAFINVIEPIFKTERNVAQQALHLFPCHVDQTIDKILFDIGFDEPKKYFKKFILSQKIRPEGLKKLSQMNINHATLLPGLEGFGKSLEFRLIGEIHKEMSKQRLTPKDFS